MNYITLPYCVNHFTSYDNINPQSVRGEAFYSLSRWRDLNPRPLPYQGSALPLSYIGNVRFVSWAEDRAQTRGPQLGRLMLYRLSYFRNFHCVGRDGFEPPKRWRSRFTVCPIWPLWNLPKPFFKDLSWASCRIRTNDPEITNHVLWPTELKRQLSTQKPHSGVLLRVQS